MLGIICAPTLSNRYAIIMTWWIILENRFPNMWAALRGFNWFPNPLFRGCFESLGQSANLSMHNSF